MEIYRGYGVMIDRRRVVVASRPLRGHAELGARSASSTEETFAYSVSSRIDALKISLSGPSLGRALLAMLGIWAFMELASLGSAIIQEHDGGWIALGTAAVMLLAALVSSIA